MRINLIFSSLRIKFLGIYQGKLSSRPDENRGGKSGHLSPDLSGGGVMGNSHLE